MNIEINCTGSDTIQLHELTEFQGELKKMAAREEKTVSAFILEKTGVNKMNEHKWFVANDNGDIIGHDMGEAKAKALAAEMQEKEPDAGWEAMNGDGE